MKESKYILPPRMVYDEWIPLDHGDPLKNDPTYDYVPPALETVYYWLGPSSRASETPAPTPSNPQVHRRPAYDFTAPSGSVYESYFQKLTNGPKYPSILYRNNYQYYPNYYYRRPPSFSYHPNKQRIRYVPNYQYKTQQKQRPFKNNSVYDRDRTKEDYKNVYEPFESRENMSHFEESSFYSDLQNHDIEEPKLPYTFLVPPPLQIPSSFIIVSQIHQPLYVQNSNKSNAPPQKSSTLWEDGNISGDEKSSNSWKSPFKFVFNGDENDEKTSNFPQIVDNLDQSTTEFYVNNTKSDDNTYLFSNNLSEKWNIETTESPNSNTITTSSSLTTDPIFSHYKQPVEPFKGPLYIIFQGHSKVKNYGSNKYQLILPWNSFARKLYE
ncbi:hypothetical protein L9F63_011867 [Diploptera punctata]|uniref:Uncharacterized protein n=1 Tax=Diploptera punctata TaxID=6984 RepID=A0AAD8AGB9_DIPPU|nr:hypothetical protein L9F63_011867 [Diploptera punctata]